MTAPKLLIIGLDSVSPFLAFDQFRQQMPQLTRLCEQGSFGPMRSTDPPITIPAWISMTSGKSPGQLGIYGFRKYQTSGGPTLTSSADVAFPRIWELAARQNLKSVVVSVPGTYPLKTHPAITMVSDFLTPSTKSRWTSRPSLATELESLFGRYIIDVADFRKGDVARIYEDCVAMTRQHFAIFRHLISREQPDFAMMTDIAPDRLHHAALQHISRQHPECVDVSMGSALYKLLDEEIGKTLELAGPQTLVMVVSDHGIKPLAGSICINEILLQSGHLVLAEPYPAAPAPLHALKVDWEKTSAYGEGGYVGRVFVSPRVRDDATRKRRVLREVKAELTGAGSTPEQPFCHRILEPGELYDQTEGVAPDLTIYFDNLNYRAAGTIGHRALRIPSNDLGVDSANHDPSGIFVMNRRSSHSTFQIYDVFATALAALDIAAPPLTLGTNVCQMS